MLTIRAAEPSDAAALTDLTRAAFAHYVPRMGREPAPMANDYPARIAAHQAWLAEQDGAVAGLLVLEPQADHLLLDTIAVAPHAQGTGLGGRLLAFAEQQARTQGFTEIRLYTHERMTENIAYYPRRGYVETHRSTEHGFHRVHFAKRISG